jgi:hypothetical protein
MSRRDTHWSLALVAAVSVVALPSDTVAQEPSAPQEERGSASAWTGPALEDVLLEVDGEPVPFARFAQWLLDVQGVELQRRFAQQVVLWRALDEHGVAPTAAEIELAARAVVEERIQRAFNGDRAAYEAELERTHSSPARDLERRAVLVEDRLARNNLARATRPAPDESTLAAAHARRYGPDGRELTVRVIRLRPDVPEPALGDDEAARERRVAEARATTAARLAALADELRRGADIAELAKRHSQDPDSRLAGGLLPAPFQRAGWPREVVAALAALDVGAPSAPLFAHGYYNLFVIEAAREVPLASVRDELEREYWAAEPDEVERRTALSRATAAVSQSLVWAFDPARDTTEGVLAPAQRYGPDAPPLTDPLFTLGDDTWTRGDLALWIARDRGGDLVRPFVRDWRLARRAAALTSPPSEAAIDVRTEATFAATLRNVYGGDRARMARDHERRGIDEAHLRAQFRREAWRDLTLDALLLAERQVTSIDVERLWAERYGPLGRSYDVRLLLRTLAGRDAAEERARLVGLLRDVRAGADFGALAARWSDDEASRAGGGRGAGRFRHEEAPEPLRRALDSLAPGETAGPVELDTHLALLHLVEERRVPLADVAEELEAELRARPPTVAERMGLLMSFDLDDACTYHAERLFASPRDGPR